MLRLADKSAEALIQELTDSASTVSSACCHFQSFSLESVLGEAHRRSARRSSNELRVRARGFASSRTAVQELQVTCSRYALEAGLGLGAIERHCKSEAVQQGLRADAKACISCATGNNCIRVSTGTGSFHVCRLVSTGTLPICCSTRRTVG